jgi:type IV pilus assembly protein PilB
MTDVDAIRWMASEHDLEFVDLDTYGVDPAAAELLPPVLARRHHVVAIKRRFGTPVIATSDPDDLYAQDSVRAAIGRDFISVVASREQISRYLDNVFGPAESATDADRTASDDGGSTPGPAIDVGSDTITPDQVKSPIEDQIVGWTDDGDDVLDSAHLDLDLGNGHLEAVNDEQTTRDGPPQASSTGKGRRTKEDRDRKRRKSASEPAPDDVSTDATGTQDRQGSANEPDLADALDILDVVAPEVPSEHEPVALTSDAMESEALDVSWDSLESGLSVEGQASGDAPHDVFGDADELEPATSLLPNFGSEWPGAAPVPPSPLAQSEDQLAELALSLQAADAPGGDEASLAADLVAEAVATYQEQQGEEFGFDQADLTAPTGTAMFPPLAKTLVDGGRVTLEDMESVLEEHYRTEQSIARILTTRKLVTEADLMWGMAEEMGLEFVDLDLVGVDLAEAGMIPEATARHHNVMVIGKRDGTPVVAASNPTDVFAMDDLRTIMGRNFIVVVATRTQISNYIGQVFNSGGDAADMAMEASLDIEGTSPDGGVDDIQAVTEEAPIVRYVNLLILQALNERASDIHIEPNAVDLRIRYRIDGVLHDVSTAPRSITKAVITRLKVMADMNIAEHRIPQDGRISLNVGSKGIDLRMATLPTIHGEKIVMRVLDKSSVVMGFTDLGFDEKMLKTYESLYTKPYGTILVTGPTGSGKSTTLYTTLTALNSPEKNIITVEDPVELPLKGVNQVQLNIKAGLNFASALRAILRSDPDIVLLGEIRDKETAVIAIEAALTGHMVLSTLHTNNAASTPMRLIEMGLEPFLVTSAVSGVLAQRLARRLCMHCKEAYEPTEADITAAGWRMEEVEALGGMPKVYRAVGCSACSNTGYRGRKALAELLPMTEEIERVIIEGGSVEEIHKVGVAQGMSTLRQSGLMKAMEGETTLEEVLRVVA